MTSKDLNLNPLFTREAILDDVLVGTDGWLFLKKGSNSLISYYQEPNKFDTNLVNAWCNLLRNRYNLLKRGKGIEYFHLFVPNKLTVYPEYSGIELNHFKGHPVCVLMKSFAKEKKSSAALRECVINPLSFYQQKKKEYLLYWKTDTHWTFWGCYWAYALLCEKIGIPPNHDLMLRNFGEANLILDLGGKIVPPVKEKARFYHTIQDSKRIYANKLVKYKENNNLENDIGLHIGSHVIYENHKVPNARKVILFGDSFSEYRPHLLTGLLAETFKEVHFIWSTSIDFSYVWSQQPDIVITEIVERFMPQVPTDNFSLEQYVQDKLGRRQKIIPHLARLYDRLRRYTHRHIS